ncbi:AmmeMemoRadiSam system protein B [Marinobacterium lutimaris]|nr:AmmeMemoRadiSam system protein B [Marinobacterium lutimaris]
MNHVRPAAVAGLFYPGQPEILRSRVTRLLDEQHQEQHRRLIPSALVVPHAGYDYSGGVAASGYSLLASDPDRARRWRRILLLGPNHRVPLRGIAAPKADLFATPLGSMAVDQTGLAELQQRFDVQVREDVHALEHCLEVQLPFLHELLPSAKLLPLVVGQERPEPVADLIEWAWDQKDILVVISTDLSHYHSYDEACRIDADTEHAILALRSDIVPEQACGAHALNGLLLAAHRRCLSAARLALCNSGDTAAPRDQVVGYGSYVIF